MEQNEELMKRADEVIQMLEEHLESRQKESSPTNEDKKEKE